MQTPQPVDQYTPEEAQFPGLPCRPPRAPLTIKKTTLQGIMRSDCLAALRRHEQAPRFDDE